MDFLGRKSINLLIDGLSTSKKSISPGFTYIVKFLTLKSPSITVKLIDGLFKGRKSINLLIDGLSTCKKSISPGFTYIETFQGRY